MAVEVVRQGKIQRPDCASRGPVRRVLLSRCTVHVVLVNVAVQSASQSCPIDTSPLVMCGNTCAVVAAVGTFGMGKRVLCVAVIVLPFGRLTVMPCCVAIWLGAVVGRKWAVAPVSAMYGIVLTKLEVKGGVNDNCDAI